MFLLRTITHPGIPKAGGNPPEHSSKMGKFALFWVFAYFSKTQFLSFQDHDSTSFEEIRHLQRFCAKSKPSKNRWRKIDAGSAEVLYAEGSFHWQNDNKMNELWNFLRLMEFKFTAVTAQKLKKRQTSCHYQPQNTHVLGCSSLW